MRTDKQTDMIKLIVAFRNFKTAPEVELLLRRMTGILFKSVESDETTDLKNENV